MRVYFKIFDRRRLHPTDTGDIFISKSMYMFYVFEKLIDRIDAPFWMRQMLRCYMLYYGIICRDEYVKIKEKYTHAQSVRHFEAEVNNLLIRNILAHRPEFAILTEYYMKCDDNMSDAISLYNICKECIISNNIPYGGVPKMVERDILDGVENEYVCYEFKYFDTHLRNIDMLRVSGELLSW